MDQQLLILVNAIVVLLILLLNIYFIQKNFVRHSPKKRYRLSYEEAKRILKTGDVLLFRSKFANWRPAFIFGDEFSHSAIVYKDPSNGELYVFENVGEGDLRYFGHNPGGVYLNPLYTRLKQYRGYVVARRLNKPLDPLRMILFEKAMENLGEIDFHYLGKYLESCILMFPIPRDNITGMNCSQIIARMLIEAKIISPKTKEMCVRPQCFARDFVHFDFLDGYSFLPDEFVIEKPR